MLYGYQKVYRDSILFVFNKWDGVKPGSKFNLNFLIILHGNPMGFTLYPQSSFCQLSIDVTFINYSNDTNYIFSKICIYITREKLSPLQDSNRGIASRATRLKNVGKDRETTASGVLHCKYYAVHTLPYIYINEKF